MCPLAPDAQQDPPAVQATVSKLTLENCRHENPPSVVMSLPVRPTASAVPEVCGSQVAPER